MTTDVLDRLRPAPSPDIAGWAGRIGAYVWVTARLFEVTGRLAVLVDDPRLARRLAGVSGRFAWQAEQWHRRLPALREVRVDDLVVPPSAETAAAFDALERDPHGGGEVLTGLLGQLATVYATHADAASPLTDGPVLRTLERTGADLQLAIAELGNS